MRGLFVLPDRTIEGETGPDGASLRLLDLLNADDQYLAVRRAALVGGGKGPSRDLENLAINRDHLLFAVPVGESPSIPDQQEQIEKEAVSALLVVPPFEISGQIHIVREADPTAFLRSASPRFIALTAAHIADFTPQDLPVVLVRRSAIAWWALEEVDLSALGDRPHEADLREKAA